MSSDLERARRKYEPYYSLDELRTAKVWLTDKVAELKKLVVTGTGLNPPAAAVALPTFEAELTVVCQLIREKELN